MAILLTYDPHHFQESDSKPIFQRAVSLILPLSDFAEVWYAHNTRVVLVLSFDRYDLTVYFPLP